jgi:hypothetical protein
MAAATKRWNATILWFVVLFVVLALLFAETRSSKTSRLNLSINGNPDSAGATVYVNGSPTGTLQSLTDADSGGTGFWTYLPDGKYTISVHKPGFNEFKTEIDLNTLGFISVDLVPKNK